MGLDIRLEQVAHPVDIDHPLPVFGIDLLVMGIGDEILP